MIAGLSINIPDWNHVILEKTEQSRETNFVFKQFSVGFEKWNWNRAVTHTRDRCPYKYELS